MCCTVLHLFISQAKIQSHCYCLFKGIVPVSLVIFFQSFFCVESYFQNMSLNRRLAGFDQNTVFSLFFFVCGLFPSTINYACPNVDTRHKTETVGRRLF